MKPTLNEYWYSKALDHWGDLWNELSGNAEPIDESLYPESVDGLQAYLIAGGVKYFSAAEITRPHGGWTTPLLPPKCAWVGLLVLCLVADRLREEIGRPISCRNAWRPEEYNELLKGASRSDHLWCCALDLDFKSGNPISRTVQRRKAQKIVQKIVPMKLLSLGVGWTVLHIGFCAPYTLEVGCHRRWKYGSLPASEKIL